MIDFALSRISGSENGFLLVAEEEGTDNFCNNGNASGCLEALGRADDAFGTIATFIEQNPDTFMVTTSDSNAGGMQIVDATDEEGQPSSASPLPPTTVRRSTGWTAPIRHPLPRLPTPRATLTPSQSPGAATTTWAVASSRGRTASTRRSLCPRRASPTPASTSCFTGPSSVTCHRRPLLARVGE